MWIHRTHPIAMCLWDQSQEAAKTRRFEPKSDTDRGKKNAHTQSMVVEEYPAVCFARHDTTRHEKRIPSAGSHQCGQCAAVPIGHFFGLVRDKATHDNVMLEHTCRLMHSCIHWQNSDIVWFESIRFILSITLARNVHHVSLCLTEPSTFLSLSLDLSVCIGQIP